MIQTNLKKIYSIIIYVRKFYYLFKSNKKDKLIINDNSEYLKKNSKGFIIKIYKNQSSNNNHLFTYKK